MSYIIATNHMINTDAGNKALKDILIDIVKGIEEHDIIEFDKYIDLIFDFLFSSKNKIYPENIVKLLQSTYFKNKPQLSNYVKDGVIDWQTYFIDEEECAIEQLKPFFDANPNADFFVGRDFFILDKENKSMNKILNTFSYIEIDD
jgi:hypothetical protein